MFTGCGRTCTLGPGRVGSEAGAALSCAGLGGVDGLISADIPG